MKRMIPVLALFVIGMFGVVWLAKADDPCNPNDLIGLGENCYFPIVPICKGVPNNQGRCIPGEGVIQNPQITKCVVGDPFSGVCLSARFNCIPFIYIQIIEGFPVPVVAETLCASWRSCAPGAGNLCVPFGPLQPPELTVLYYNTCCPVAIPVQK